MAINEAWGRRLRDAKRDYEKRHDTSLSFGLIGERVATVLGRPKPFAPTSARSWFVEGQEPETFAIAAAIAEVLEADPAALVFGGRPHRIPTLEEIAAEGGGVVYVEDPRSAEEQLADEDAERKAATRRRAGGRKAG